MADYEQVEAATAQSEQSPGLGMFASWIGAGLSLALAIAIGMWAYQTIMSDVSGVPVIKASSDPMRVAPENPGGLSAQNKGLSVNRVAEEVASKAPDQVMLAPSPVSLSEDDLASGALKAQNSENSSMVLNAPIPLDINNLPDDLLRDSGARDGSALPANGRVRKQLRRWANRLAEKRADFKWQINPKMADKSSVLAIKPRCLSRKNLSHEKK